MKKLSLFNVNLKFKTLPSLKKLKANKTKIKKLNHQIWSKSSTEEDYHFKERKLRKKLLGILEKKQALPPEELINLLSEIASLDKGTEDDLNQEDINEKFKSIFKEISQKNIQSEKKLDEMFGIPEIVKKGFRELGIWDMFSDYASRYEKEPLQLWTEEEFKVMDDDSCPDGYTTEEEVEWEETKIRAVKKMEDFFSTYPIEPGQILNMILEGKGQVEANEDPFNTDNEFFEDDEFNDPGVEIDEPEEIEKYLSILAKGGDVPKIPDNLEVREPDDPETFKKKLDMIQDRFYDQFRKGKDRKLTPEEVKEIDTRWQEAFPEEEPIAFDDINYIKPPPDWPEWMEKHFRKAQHIVYLLRAAHIDGRITEPGRRLKKYNLISDNLNYEDPAIITNSFEDYFLHMKKLFENGVVTEASNLFGSVNPPENGREASEDNPWTWNLVIDLHLNVPIPDWYHEIIDDVEANMTEEEMTQQFSEIANEKEFYIMDDIEKTLNNAPKNKENLNTKRNKTKKQSKIPAKALELKEKKFSKIKSEFDKIGIGRAYKGKTYMPHPNQKPANQNKATNKRENKEEYDDDDDDDDGYPYWQQDNKIGDKWKDGNYYTINATLIYNIDIKKGQISDIFMGWGAVLGSIISTEDAEKLYCEVSGANPEKRPKREDYEDWEEYQYKPIRKDPIQWFKENIFGKN